MMQTNQGSGKVGWVTDVGLRRWYSSWVVLRTRKQILTIGDDISSFESLHASPRLNQKDKQIMA